MRRAMNAGNGAMLLFAALCLISCGTTGGSREPVNPDLVMIERRVLVDVTTLAKQVELPDPPEPEHADGRLSGRQTVAMNRTLAGVVAIQNCALGTIAELMKGQPGAYHDCVADLRRAGMIE